MKESKRLKASALRYDSKKNSAPLLIAKGRGELAEKIIEIAKKENIPITKNNMLADMLDGLDIYEEIPPEMYKVVANIFAFLHKLNEKAAGRAPDSTFQINK
ncbi:MAG: EscU/YscU/HrcU family type III secretion system export apparatus switch protein [bacterium]